MADNLFSAEMVRRALYVWLSIAATLPGAQVNAQDTLELKTRNVWDLPQCIRYAIKHNIQINTLRLEEKISQQELQLANAARWPGLSAAASQTLTHTVQPNLNISGTSSKGLGSSGNYALNASITLYNGGSIQNTILQKQDATLSAAFTVKEQENDITLQITRAYLTILLDREAIVYDQDILTTSRSQVKLEAERFRVGSAAKKDLIQIQAQNAQDEYTLVSAKNAERGDLLTLKQLLTLPVEDSLDIVVPDTLKMSAIIVPLDSALQQAYRQRPEIKNAKLGIQIAEYGVKIAQAGYLPTLTATAAAESGYSDGHTTYFTQLGNNFYQQAGLTLDIPIFTRRTVKTHVEEAKINIEQASLNKDNTQIVLAQAVERAYLDIQNAAGQYQAARQQFEFSKESYRIANAQLRIGSVNITDFLVVKSQYVQAEQALLEAHYSLLLYQQIYNLYRGIPVNL